MPDPLDSIDYVRRNRNYKPIGNYFDYHFQIPGMSQGQPPELLLEP
jgi:hypothetical protein